MHIHICIYIIKTITTIHNIFLLHAVGELKQNEATPKEDIDAAVDKMKAAKLEIGALRSELIEIKQSHQYISPLEAHGKVVNKATQPFEMDRVLNWLSSTGMQKIDGTNLREKIENISNNNNDNNKDSLHHYFKRDGVILGHRDFDEVLDNYKIETDGTGNFYIVNYVNVTGPQGKSESLTMAHTVPLELCQYLQKVFNVIVIVQIGDDERFYRKGTYICIYIQTYMHCIIHVHA